MHQITIRLPSNRDYTGTLKLENAKGKLIAGPFQVCARSHDELARAHGNPDRISILPFGDMPLGEYQISQIVKSGPGTPYASDEYGSAGIIFLQPKHGEAALADANGRFIFLIQGGALSRNGALRPTEDGSLRLSNRDQRKLVGTLRRIGEGACRFIVTNSGSAKRRVAVSSPARSNRGPTGNDAAQPGLLSAGATAAGLAEPSRRSWLRTMLIAAGAFAAVPSLLLFSQQKAFGEDGGTDYSPKKGPTPTDEDLHDAPNDPKKTPTVPLTPFPQDNPPPVDQTPVQKPQGGNDTKAIDQAGGIRTNPNENTIDPQIGFDTPGDKNTNSNSTSTVVTSTGTPAGAEPPIDTSSLPPNDPDVQNLNKYQQQLKQDQAAAAQAQADYNAQKQTDPNANQAAMLAAQAKFNATQNMVKYETNQVKAKLPPLPTAKPAAPQQPKGQ
ncbi:MAG TPA: hypothetical protein VK815_12420 [Candidatus Acidoferrales bacterium]|nr:hypothetical protein [Candidatus Acidoferrales bacterium]